MSDKEEDDENCERNRVGKDRVRNKNEDWDGQGCLFYRELLGEEVM